MGFWFRRTGLEKCLIVSFVIALCLAIGLMVGVIVIKNRADADPDALVCQSAECLIAAAALQSALNLTADPCEDFYEYSCGGWMKNNIISPERSRWSQFDVTRKILLDKLRVLLDDDIDPKYPPIVGSAIGFYKQCQNMTKRDSDGLDRLSELLKGLDFPMLNKGNLNDPTGYNWTRVYAQLNRDIGLTAIINNYVYLDAKNTTLYSIYVDAPSFGVGRAQLVNPDTQNNKRILDAYKQYIKSSVILLTNETYDRLDADIEDLLNFEKELANITADAASRRDRQNLYGNKSYISEFENTYAGIPLLSIEQQVFQDITDANINGNSPLIVYDRNYFNRVGDILGNTDSKVIANYLGWRAVRSLGGSTTKAFRDVEFEYNKVVSGVTEPRPVWEECVDTVNNRLAFAVGRLYVDNNFNETAKQDTNAMIDQLDEAFGQLLDANDWMQSETKEKAREKLDKMLRAIGFPDFIENDAELSKYYDQLNLDPTDSYLSSVLAYTKWSNNRSNKKLNTYNTNRTELDWSTGPAIVNAFFSPNINRITFPAGILQAPFYTFGLPIALNLGAIGVVIGHEITHSFDDSGSQYDEYGNLFDWWDNKTKAEFTQKVKCFIDQYSSYNDSLAGIPVNGSTTIGENIADNGGLRQAFRALENYGGEKQILPTSMKQFSSEQLFFLSFANVWCTNIRKEALINQIETDAHSPGKYRVWGSVSNSEAFAKAFNCKANSNMNPSDDKKCILW